MVLALRRALRASAAVRALACALACALATGARAAGEGWDGWPVFVWRLEHEGRELPDALLAPFGGTNVEGDDEAGWVLERGLDYYVGRAAGWSLLHLERDFPWYAELLERWSATRERDLLVRRPCLADPRTRERLSEELARTLAARGGRSGLALLLGDEIGLTPAGDPLDLCRGPHCLEAWRAWCRARLGCAPGEEPPFPDTDEVRRAWTDGDPSLLGTWLACRRFQRERMVALVRSLAAEARERAPDATLGLTGLVGATAFGGVAFDELLDVLDLLEAYPVVDARELLLTLRTTQRTLATVVAPEGEDARRPGAVERAAWEVAEHWLRGEDALVLWSDRALADEALRARLAEAVALVRALERELGRWRPATADLAVLHDDDATALAFLRDALLDGPTWPRRFAGWQAEHGTRERALGAWLRLAEDCGLLPGALPIVNVDARASERFRVLVAPHQLVLDERDLERLAGFVRAGGTLVLEGELCRFDRAGRERPERARAWLDSLPEEARARVVAAPAALADYERTRARPDDGRAREARAFLRALLAPRAARPTADERPWLLATRPGPGAGLRTVVALPARLARDEPVPDGLALALDPPPLRWVHPALDEQGQRRLRAGEPAVWIERAP